MYEQLLRAIPSRPPFLCSWFTAIEYGGGWF